MNKLENFVFALIFSFFINAIMYMFMLPYDFMWWSVPLGTLVLYLLFNIEDKIEL